MSEETNMRSIWKNIFTGHREEELEAHWATGTLGNIPSIEAVDAACPKPWGFVRVIGFAVVAYLLLLYGWYRFHNVYLLPGLMVVGAAAFPIGVSYLFFELNIRRNVSMYLVDKLLFIGGILSLIVSLFMFLLTDFLHLGWLGASVAGIAEETGKLLAVVIVARRLRYPYILNGILFGVAVGSGFAFLETAGYAMNELVKGIIAGTLANKDMILTIIGNHSANSLDTILGIIYTKIAAHVDKGMLETLTVRSLLAPFGHMLWTGIAAGALWRVCKTEWNWSCLSKVQFWGFFLIAVVLHGVWNAPFDFCILTSADKYILLGVIGWAVLLYEVRLGFEQVREEKRAALAAYHPTELESGLQDVLQVQRAYAEAMSTPVSMPASPAPRAEDHLGIDEAVKASTVREQQRPKPEVTSRRWEKYYESKNETPVAATPATPEAPEAKSSNEGTSSGRSWRKYYKD